MAGYVFISYSRADRGYVDLLAAHLRARGVDVWYDFEVETGDSFGARIQQAIDGCAAFVAVLSPASVGSEWVRREIARGTRARKPIHPLLRHRCDVPIELDGVQYEDVTRGQLPTDRFVDALARATRATAAGAPPPPRIARPARTGRVLVPLVVIALVAGLVGGGVWWLVNRDNSGQASATSSPGTSTVRPTEIRTQPAPTPQRLNSVNRASPGCDESDSRVVWKTIRGDVSCSSTAMTLTKRVGWDDGYLQSYAELRMSLREQQLPDSFTVSFTISGLSAPELEVNRGGCGGLAVHTTPDGRTYDYFNICADGWVEFVRVVGNTGVDNETRQLTPAPHQGSSPSYSVIVSVSASRVEVTVSNQVGESTSISSPVVGGTTSYLALMTTWRNVGATASFSDFTYSAAG